MSEEQETADKIKTKRVPPGPVSEEDVKKYKQQLKKEEEERAEKLRISREREKKWYQLQAEFMRKDQSGIRFFESQVESLKLFVIYLKEIDYRLPAHMTLKPYSIIVKELIETLSKISFAKYMDEEWVKKNARELSLIKSHIDGAIMSVKARKKYMVYL